MPAGGIADADAISVALSWLRQHPLFLAEFGSAEHVSGVLEAPWPHLVVGDGPGGSEYEGRWRSTQEVSLELYGHPSGLHGKAALKRYSRIVMACLIDLADSQVVGPSQPAVSLVEPSGVLAFQPLQTGQGRYTFGALVTLRPPLQMP